MCILSTWRLYGNTCKSKSKYDLTSKYKSKITLWIFFVCNVFSWLSTTDIHLSNTLMYVCVEKSGKMSQKLETSKKLAIFSIYQKL